MPPRIRRMSDVITRPDPPYVPASSTWACSRRGHFLQGVDGVHGRWTALLLMAELSAGRASFGEPRWQKYTVLRLNGTTWVDVTAEEHQQWRLMWPCRRCKAWFARPADHLAHHATADRIRVARMLSFDGTVG